MTKNSIDKKEIENLLPHRDPMLLIDKLINIVHLKSATAIVHVKKTSFFVQGHFPGQPVMPGVLIVEAFGQAAAALTAYGIDKKLKPLFNVQYKFEHLGKTPIACRVQDDLGGEKIYTEIISVK